MPKLAVRSRHSDLKLADKACPHCDGPLDDWHRVADGRSGWRCRKCHCRWDAHRLILRFGSDCPLYVRA